MEAAPNGRKPGPGRPYNAGSEKEAGADGDDMGCKFADHNIFTHNYLLIVLAN
jgi:hypothetical protein